MQIEHILSIAAIVALSSYFVIKVVRKRYDKYLEDQKLLLEKIERQKKLRVLLERKKRRVKSLRKKRP